jgi:hypothetical protein
MTAKCREGHESTELDYCSVCGAAMPVARPSSAALPIPFPTSAHHRAATATSCPQCGEPRPEPDARLCEVCRYDYVSQAPGPPPAARAPAPAPALAKWELVLTVDPSLDAEPDPASPPPNDPERIFPVEVSEMLVGRRDDSQNIRPAVPLNDPGASRRHAKFLRQADGSVVLHDLAPVNGTKLNGEDVVSGSQRALADGDEVTLGRWSRIKLRVRA